MAWSKVERVRELAQLVGITVIEDELAEVADRFDCLLRALEKLAVLDLSGIQPVTVFPEEPEHDA